MSIEIRSYLPGDEKKILELFLLTFKKPMTMDYWTWRFKNNPYGDIEIILAFDGDKLAGHYAISPLSFEMGGRKFKAAHSMTTMTHPDYQGRGLFNKLAAALYQSLQKKSYDFVWGFPNANSFPGLVKKLKWSPLVQIPNLKCTEAVDAPGDVIIVQDSQLLSDDEFLCLKDSNSNALEVEKNSFYFTWRYLDNPDNQYHFLKFFEDKKLIGFAITKKYLDEIDVLEFFTKQDAADKVLTSLRYYYLAQEKNKGLNVWSSIHHWSYLSFMKNKFTPQTPLTYMGYLNLRDDDKAVELNNPVNWNFTMGDSDVH